MYLKFTGHVGIEVAIVESTNILEIHRRECNYMFHMMHAFVFDGITK